MRDIDRPTLSITEGEQTELALSHEHYLMLKQRYVGRLDLAPSATTGHYILTARDYIGRLTLPPNHLLEIRPKVAVSNLFYMLCVDAGLAEFFTPPTRLAQGLGVFHFVITAFISSVEHLAAQGLNHDYFPMEADLPLVRGRIDLGEQINRFGELRHRHACAFAELSTDTAENKVLLAALSQIPFLLGEHEADTTRRARYISRRFESVSPLARSSALRLLATMPSHRLNARYGPTLRLARLVLNHITLENRAGGYPFASFLVNMPRLFESFVTRRLSALVRPYGLKIVAQRHDYLDEEHQIGIRPDMLVYERHSAEPLLVIDTKYRLFDRGDINSDLYQVSAYLDRYGLERGLLIYPQFQGTSRSNLRLVNTPKYLHVLPLNLDAATSAELEASCGHLAGQVALLSRASKAAEVNLE